MAETNKNASTKKQPSKSASASTAPKKKRAKTVGGRASSATSGAAKKNSSRASSKLASGGARKPGAKAGGAKQRTSQKTAKRSASSRTSATGIVEAARRSVPKAAKRARDATSRAGERARDAIARTSDTLTDPKSVRVLAAGALGAAAGRAAVELGRYLSHGQSISPGSSPSAGRGNAASNVRKHARDVATATADGLTDPRFTMIVAAAAAGALAGRAAVEVARHRQAIGGALQSASGEAEDALRVTVHAVVDALTDIAAHVGSTFVPAGGAGDRLAQEERAGSQEADEAELGDTSPPRIEDNEPAGLEPSAEFQPIWEA